MKKLLQPKTPESTDAPAEEPRTPWTNPPAGGTAPADPQRRTQAPATDRQALQRVIDSTAPATAGAAPAPAQRRP